MKLPILTDDTKAILLLCGRFGEPLTAEPLEPRDYNAVVRWLMGRRMRPSDLLSLESLPELAAETGIDRDRLAALLKRGVKLGFAVEKWNQSGIWVISRSDTDYPARYKEHLKDKAPPVLFGAGDRALLRGGGLAIVGSRNVDAMNEGFARDVAVWCARGGLPVVSGGARGVDQVAMAGALEAGGAVLGVLADSLLRRSVSREARLALAEGRLLLVSPYHPEAGFNVGNAMGRNKLIYALADYGLVVVSDYKKGGTWAGAEEELKRRPGRTLFVQLASAAPLGNRKLRDLGALPFPSISEDGSPGEVLRRAASTGAEKEPLGELPLFMPPASREPAPALVREAVPAPSQPTPDPAAPVDTTSAIYLAVLPVILRHLEQPATVDDLSRLLDVPKTLLNAWLKRALTEKRVRRQNRPVRYVAV
jgi:predicted Rossmann fold nucleotide-binding protein DprA/Smf involved in DNA uptake